MTPIIKTINLTKIFGTNTAVNTISLEVHKGEVFGLLGPNGAGKTTLLSMLCTILKPTSGTAVINGYDIIQSSAMVRRSIGIVFQDPSVDTDMTSRENLQMHADLYDVPVSEQASRIQEVLTLVQLEDRADQFLKTYSGGMRRRLEIARGLLHYPRVLFLDEPTIGLDPQSREHIWSYIRQLREREDMTLILTTHYMEEADELCDRIAIIDHGTIVALDTPSALKQTVGSEMILLKTDDPEKLQSLLVHIPEIDTIRAIDNEVRISVTNADDELPRIMEIAFREGVHMSSVHLSRPDMNDVFMHYTGREIREEGPESISKMRMMRRRSRR
ncbi:MAG TPA: ATP-binding cassette domain-containing protein [Methanospirillum sp.]|uniref:ATP-binding cassette domain-containing protein n=1 Tax=Methanospirillum sp. TaxID=45200 RepID=UPI002B819E33|nr:ATP-binding cassette domain-containing protein [Methanospirillum sp.]HWQ63015.1 ATP-binding cassette domain-containing protein [Methanospirillum sp.]